MHRRCQAYTIRSSPRAVTSSRFWLEADAIPQPHTGMRTSRYVGTHPADRPIAPRPPSTTVGLLAALSASEACLASPATAGRSQARSGHGRRRGSRNRTGVGLMAGAGQREARCPATAGSEARVAGLACRSREQAERTPRPVVRSWSRRRRTVPASTPCSRSDPTLTSAGSPLVSCGEGRNGLVHSPIRRPELRLSSVGLTDDNPLYAISPAPPPASRYALEPHLATSERRSTSWWIWWSRPEPRAFHCGRARPRPDGSAAGDAGRFDLVGSRWSTLPGRPGAARQPACPPAPRPLPRAISTAPESRTSCCRTPARSSGKMGRRCPRRSDLGDERRLELATPGARVAADGQVSNVVTRASRTAEAAS